MSNIKLSKTHNLSTDEQLDVAIALCEVLGVDADNDDNLWKMLELLEDEGTLDLIREEWGE